MTRRLRIIVLATIVAALFGAPSAVFGASPTRLYGAIASPTSGTTATIFTFSVRFDGSGKFAAGPVVANVAGRSLTMVRVAGTPHAGTYRVRATLPEGSWTPSFETAPSQGPEATLTGPTVTVSAPTPKPKATPGTAAPTTISIATEPPPSASDRAPAINPAPSASKLEAPVAPAPSSPAAAPTDAILADDSSAGDAAVDAPDSAPSGGSSHGGGVTGGSGSRAGTPKTAPKVAPKESAADGGAGPSSSDVQPTATAGLDGQERPLEDGLPASSGMLAYILGGIAAITAFTAFVLLLWRRRDDEDEPAAATATPATTPWSKPVSRRSLRRGRMEQANDPILESMGLNEGTDASKIAVKASQVHRGPGVREPVSRR